MPIMLAAADFNLHIPKPDDDPLDIGGHGTHVAGTVAGLAGLEKTYEGVAPETQLHAIKVFGAGSTSDAVGHRRFGIRRRPQQRS